MPLPAHIRAMMDVGATIVCEETFGTRDLTKEVALAAYHRRAEEVKAAIPASRLLVYDVAEGWGPLCDFLGVPVPSAPFPHLNVKDDFWTVVGGEPPDP
jgi:hypothetical protein